MHIDEKYLCSLSDEFKKALLKIHKIFQDKKIRWALVGSTNMRLQGINVQPRDVDIVVQKRDLGKVQELFCDCSTSEINELKPFIDEPSWELKVRMGDVEAQFFGQNDTGEYAHKMLEGRLVYIDFGTVQIPCFTLEAEAEVYAETRREKKAQLIREFLERRQI